MRAPDLLVLGGGPAGAALATFAAQAGLRVVLCERERFPRDKVCGEFLSAEARPVLRRLGVEPELLGRGVTRMEACRITDRWGRAVDGMLPDLGGGEAARAALGVSRSLLDATLLEAAGRLGVDVRERAVATAPLLEGDRVVGARVRAVGSAGEAQPLYATVVAAADGRRSMLVRALHPGLGDPARSGPGAWFGLKVHLEGPADRLGDRVELHLFDGGYAGLGTVEGGRINLCLMVSVRALRACGNSAERLLRERILSNPAAARILIDSRVCGPWKSVGPLQFGVRRPAAAGALFVGDAAGTIDPFCGEGMAHALRAAEMAARVAALAISAGGLDAHLAAAYTDDWHRSFGASTRRARRIGRLLESPRAAGAALGVLSMLGPRLFSRVVAGTRTGVVAGGGLAKHEDAPWP